jgi:hypothetical protein
MYRSHVLRWLNLTPCFEAGAGAGGGGGGTGAGAGGTGAGAGGTGAGAGGTGSGTPAAGTFTQHDVDMIIQERLIADRARRPGMSDTEKAELERLRADKAERDRKALEEKGNYEAALKSKDTEFDNERKTFKTKEERILGKLRETSVRSKIIAAATDAYKPAQVADLLERRIRLNDEFEPEVLEPDLKTRAFKNGKELTVDELVAQYLDENPHMRRAAKTGGSGSPGGASTHAEGAAAAGTDTGELATLKKSLDDAEKRAKETHDVSDVTAAHKAKRLSERAVAAAAAKK